MCIITKAAGCALGEFHMSCVTSGLNKPASARLEQERELAQQHGHVEILTAAISKQQHRINGLDMCE